jgi:pimeloyl-ACP methyl ester carboxylesterase
MAVDATLGVTDLVEELHARIARLPVRASGPIGAAVAGTTGLVYRGVRGVTRVVGSGLDGVLGRLVPLLDDVADTPGRDQLVAALNGVLGDYLARSGNPLAIPLALRRDGVPLVLERNALSAAYPLARSAIVVAVHGLCMSDRQWTRKGHDHGVALAGDLDATLLRLHYNSGRHVHETGRDFAAVLDALVDQWPVPIDRLHLLGHSMGGLVARSAAHVGATENHRWRRSLATITCLGTPHLGAPLERGGHGIDILLDKLPYTAPFARLGRLRSAGITDLRHGSVIEDTGDARGRPSGKGGKPDSVGLPADVDCFAIAACRDPAPDDIDAPLRGDGLVPVASALGIDDDPDVALAFPEAHRWIAHGTGHLDLLAAEAVYAKLRDWIVAADRARGVASGNAPAVRGS